MITPVAECLTDDDIRALCRLAAQIRQRRRELEAAQAAQAGAGIPVSACTRSGISVTLRDYTEGTTRHDH